jgi:hypothetical protein
MLSRISLGSAPESEMARCSIRDSTPPRLVAGYTKGIQAHAQDAWKKAYHKVFGRVRKKRGMLFVLHLT